MKAAAHIIYMIATQDEAKVSARKPRRPKPGQSLADLRKDLASEWHPDNDLKPDEVTLGSTLKVRWICQKRGVNHPVYESQVRSRANAGKDRPTGSGCPKCGPQKGGLSRSTPRPGQSLADIHNNLATQWHPDNVLLPTAVKPGSAIMVRWVCPRTDVTHPDFEMTVRDRTSTGKRGCPKCGEERAALARSTPQPGQSLAELRPDLCLEWHPSNDVLPTAIRPGSAKQARWLCPRKDVTHPSYETKVAYRVKNTVGCPLCAAENSLRGIGNMTKTRLLALLQSFRPVIRSGAMTPAMLQAVCLQAGAAGNRVMTALVHGGTVAELVAGLDDAMDEMARQPGDGSTDDESSVADKDLPEDGFEADLMSGTVTVKPGKDADRTKVAADTDKAFEVPGGITAKPVGMPEPHAADSLSASGMVLAVADADAAQYIIAAGVEELWKLAYVNPDKVDTATNKPRKNEYEEAVRAAFRSEFDAAQNMVLPAGWSFRPEGEDEIVEPLLMQKHVAVQLNNRRRIGNWSGTGAGKTVSAVLGARLIGAGEGDGVVLIIAPNNTIAGWKRTILNCFPDSRISLSEGLIPKWAPGSGPRWMVVNFEKFSQTGSVGKLSALLSGGDVHLDMVVIDEIHRIKYRGDTGFGAAKDESATRENIKSMLAEAGGKNPEMAVLGMSATPVVNDLTEGRSILELIHGKDFADLQTRATLANCHRMHQQYVVSGTRFMPKYEADLDEVTIEVSCENQVEAIRALPRNAGAAAIERILLEAKLPYIIDVCKQVQSRGQRTFIYTHYRDGLVQPMHAALEKAGLTVAEFTGTHKDDLGKFTGHSEDGKPVRDADRVDVLIGTSAIATGVDGLQHAADAMIFACLPWTAAEKQQTIGRLHRTGQRSQKVTVYTPITSAESCQMPDPLSIGTRPWSYCRRRMEILASKKSVADAVVDGAIPANSVINRGQAVEGLLDWIHRVRKGEVYSIQRPDLKASPLDMFTSSTPNGMRRFSDFSKMNGRWTHAASSTTGARLTDDPSEWSEYHRLYSEAREDWLTVPAIRFGKWLNIRQPGTVADLGCGQMLLADTVTVSHDIHGFDHVAIDGRVTACDISAVPLDDQSVDYAVLSLALMGSNYMDYLREAHRITKAFGQVWIAETVRRTGDDEDRIRGSLRDFGLRLVEVQTDERFIYLRAERGLEEPTTDPEPFLLQTEQTNLEADS